MAEDSIVNTKYRLLDLFSELDEAEMDEIEQWISSLSYRKGKMVCGL